MGIGFHWYGFWVMIGAVVWVGSLLWDKRVTRIISIDQLLSCVNCVIIAGVVSGRALHVIINWSSYDSWFERIAFWDGGLSVLGAFGGILSMLLVFVYIHGLPLCRFLDAVLFYAPLAQAFGRIGCVAAGCCYGCQTACSWGVLVDTAEGSFFVHPVPWYNVILLVTLFIFLLFMRARSLCPGTITWIVLSGILAIRGITDFWRGDREFFSCNDGMFSVHQWISLVLVLIISAWYVLYCRRGCACAPGDT